MRLACAALLFFLFTSVHGVAGTPGTFRGTLVEASEGTSSCGCIYVQGRNGLVRRVQTGGAQVVYAEDFPASQKKKEPSAALVKGAEVRVEAEPDKDGEWQAQRIELLPAKPAGKPSNPTKKAKIQAAG